MTQKFKFRDPHPGFGGAAVRLPDKIVNFIAQFDGEELSFEEFKSQFVSLFSEGELRLDTNHEMILYHIKIPSGIEHCWRLFRISPVN